MLTCSGTTKKGQPCKRSGLGTDGRCPAHPMDDSDALRGGAPSKLTEKTTAQILQWVSHGALIETSCRAAGIHKSTLYLWLKQAAEDRKAGKNDTPHVVFLDALEKAAAHSDVKDIELIGSAARTHWQAAAWRQERKNPKEWGRKDHLAISGVDGEPPVLVTAEVALGDETRELAEELLRRAAARRGDTGGR